MKWGPASLPAPTAPSEGSAKLQNRVPGEPNPEFRLTSSGVASHRSTPSEEEPSDLYFSAPAEASLLFRAARPDPKVKTDRCSAALLGMTLNQRPALPPTIRRPPSAASRDRKIISSGASSRLAPHPLRRASALPAGGDRIFGHLPHLLAVAGFPMRPGPPSRSQLDLALDFRVAPSEKYRRKPVDNVDIGNNRRNLF